MKLEIPRLICVETINFPHLFNGDVSVKIGQAVQKLFHFEGKNLSNGKNNFFLDFFIFTTGQN